MALDKAEIARRRALIEQLDLEVLRDSLIAHQSEGEGWSFKSQGWTLEQALDVEKWYRRFLILMLMFPDHNLIPHSAIDRMWHAHIAIDTRKYQKDCVEIFGYFLHHDPSNHEMPKDVVDFWYERTNKYFRDLFGEDYTKLSWAE